MVIADSKFPGEYRSQNVAGVSAGRPNRRNQHICVQNDIHFSLRSGISDGRLNVLLRHETGLCSLTTHAIEGNHRFRLTNRLYDFVKTAFRNIDHQCRRLSIIRNNDLVASREFSHMLLESVLRSRIE